MLLCVARLHIAQRAVASRVFGVSHCCEVHERLRMMPDSLAALVVGSVKAVVRSRQCRFWSTRHITASLVKIFLHETSSTSDNLPAGLLPLLMIPSWSIQWRGSYSAAASGFPALSTVH